MRALLIGIFLMATACSESNRPQDREAAVRELITDLDASADEYQNIPFQPLTELKEEVEPYFQWFYRSYTDTSKPSFWINELSSLQRVHKAIAQAPGQQKLLAESIEYSKSQLQDLAASANDLDSLSFATYLADEQAVADELISRVSACATEYSRCRTLWSELRPKLDSTRAYHTDR